MSYDLAVWEGPRPKDDTAALETYLSLYDRYVDTDETFEPTPAIRRYVEALLARWPDITTDDGEDSPWSGGPMIDNAAGPFFYFGMGGSQLDDASQFAAEVAAAHGLNCFDPQSEALRPSDRPLAPVPDKPRRRRRWGRRGSSAQPGARERRCATNRPG